METREILITIDYLLRKTDFGHGAMVTKIVDYIKENYNIESRRQTIKAILDSLYDNNDILKKFGFQIGKRIFGNSSYERYYIETRLLNIDDINNIKTALDEAIVSNSVNLCCNEEEIIEGLTKIFASDFDIERNNTYLGNINYPAVNNNSRDLVEKINEAFNNGYKISIHTTDGVIYEGRILYMYPKNNTYYIVIYVENSTKRENIDFKDIVKITIESKADDYHLGSLRNGISQFPSKTTAPSFGGLSNNGLVHNFMTVTPNNQRQRVTFEFDFYDEDLESRIYKEFSDNYARIIRSRCESSVGFETKFHAQIYAERDAFINWVSNPSIILNIYDLTPNSVYDMVKDKFSVTSNIINRRLKK